ncbi:MAG: DUF4433 domain-containing protein [Candidatus Sumerlaeota bacterium]|nr:DUF4433 domain-containing protein [Candidatus Sumerlaeota bacterium]
MPQSSSNTPPIPTPIYRMAHIDNLPTLLERNALHAPNHLPHDGLPYVGIHSAQTQADRGTKPVPCGPGGIISDYVGFYFGTRSPMLYRIHTGHGVTQVDQSSIVYLVSSAQAAQAAGLGFVFYDGHSLAAFSEAFADLGRLDAVDWTAVNLTYWNDTPDDMDRQRRKQAEFLVHRSMPWRLIERIGVCNSRARARVAAALAARPERHQPVISVESSWYY